MAPVVASDIYPAVRAFLEENELQKSVKAFDKDTKPEDGDEAPPAKSKKALQGMALVAASQAWLDAQAPAKPRTVEAADVWPSLRRFLVEAGLQKSSKALKKEMPADEEAPASKKAKALADLELTAACQAWLEAQAANGDAVEEAPKKKKRKAAEEAEAEAAEAEEAPAKKKPKKVAAADEQAAAEEGEKKSKKEKKEKNATKIAGTPFQRIDCEKWTATIKDARLKDNTHKAKEAFGEDAGDAWGDKASEDLGKVKGKGFRKEMAKKKRSSWRGGGEINQGVNSIAFSDSDDE